MSERQLRIFSESNAEETLRDQIQVYHGLRRRAQSLLRLIVAVLAVSVTFMSVVLSGIFETDISIESFEYYYNQAATAVSVGDNTLIALVLVYIIGFVFTFASIFYLLSGVMDVISVTGYGIHPYTSGYVAEDTEMVSISGEDSKAKSDCIERNSRIISDMHTKSIKSYKHFGYSIILLTFGIVFAASAHFAEIELAQSLASTVFVFSFALVLSKAIARFLNRNIRTYDARKTIEDVDDKMSKITKFFVRYVPVALVTISTGIIMYLFGDLTQPLIWFGITVIAVVLFVGLIVNVERKNREIQLFDSIPFIGNKSEECEDSKPSAARNENNNFILDNESDISKIISREDSEDMVRIESVIEESDERINYSVDITKSMVHSAREEFSDDN
jgi:hypothetical protein